MLQLLTGMPETIFDPCCRMSVKDQFHSKRLASHNHKRFVNITLQIESQRHLPWMTGDCQGSKAVNGKKTDVAAQVAISNLLFEEIPCPNFQTAPRIGMYV